LDDLGVVIRLDCDSEYLARASDRPFAFLSDFLRMPIRPRKIAAAPRNAPRQARAQATVTAILEATIRILEREGMDAATTTRIAEVAGVSVGTLYQYFAHRDAILDALQDREFQRALTLMGSVLSDDNLTKNPRETVTAVVRGLGQLYASCPALHRVLVIEGLRVIEPARVEAFDLRVVAIIRHFLVATGARVRRDNVEAAAFVIFQAVRAVMLACLLERPAGLDEDALSEELVDLVLRYLVDDAPPKKTAKTAKAPKATKAKLRG
jgi:AcrR family transcriptional regulator